MKEPLRGDREGGVSVGSPLCFRGVTPCSDSLQLGQVTVGFMFSKWSEIRRDDCLAVTSDVENTGFICHNCFLL